MSSFTHDLQRRSLEGPSRVLEAVIRPAENDLSCRLNIPRGAEVVRLSRLRLANQLPIAVQLTHLPHHLCPGLLKIDFSDRSLYDGGAPAKPSLADSLGYDHHGCPDAASRSSPAAAQATGGGLDLQSDDVPGFGHRH